MAQAFEPGRTSRQVTPRRCRIYGAFVTSGWRKRFAGMSRARFPCRTGLEVVRISDGSDLGWLERCRPQPDDRVLGGERGRQAQEHLAERGGVTHAGGAGNS